MKLYNIIMSHLKSYLHFKLITILFMYLSAPILFMYECTERPANVDLLYKIFITLYFQSHHTSGSLPNDDVTFLIGTVKV